VAETASGDFLKKDARTPLRGMYLAAGVNLRIETNSESILQITEQMFGQPAAGFSDREDIRLRLWVDEMRHADEPRPKPYFRGLGHMVFAGFDESTSVLMNPHDRSAVGRFTPEAAVDTKFWKMVLFPALLTVLGPSAGLTPLHCACVSWKGSGLLLAGGSGSGKSSLSLALAQSGFDFLADDRTLISTRGGSVLAWGLSPEMKHCSDAVIHFPELEHIECSEIAKGERVFRFDPVEVFGITRVQWCEPRWILFLERESAQMFLLDDIELEVAAERLQKDLHRETPATAERQRQAIETLLTRGCRTLRYGGDPHQVADALLCLVKGGWNAAQAASFSVPNKSFRGEITACDPLRRFRATPLTIDVLAMGKSIRVETDSHLILKHATRAFIRFERTKNGPSQFVWRIVSEPSEEPQVCWPPLTAFSDETVRYINIGRRSFVAMDLMAREAVGILPESFARDETGFSSVFLASMFYLTAPMLGLQPVSAACVAQGKKGLLVFGPPNSGKTTSSYSARKLGLDFHADQSVFLELDSGAVRAWGDFWPASFRPETIRLLPELSALARTFSYRDRTFLCLDKEPSISRNAESVIPTACIFLEREDATPRLIPLSNHDTRVRVRATAPFKDDAGSTEEREAVFTALSRLPSYRLIYGDPSVAAFFFRSVLNTHHVTEDRP